MTLSIADTPEALTADWLTEALRDHLGGARVTEATTTPLGTGQMCDSVRIALTYDGETTVARARSSPSCRPRTRRAATRR